VAKAAEALPTTPPGINRRSLLGGGALGAVALAAPAAHAFPAVTAPTSAGARVLELVAEQRALSAVWDSDEDVASARNVELCDAIETIGKSIITRPIASVSDIIDRAILAAWACQPRGSRLTRDDSEGLKDAYIIDVLGLAGIRPEQCNADFVIG
jgi:hypothetical protein